MKHLLAPAAALSILVSATAYAQSPSQLVFKVLEEAGCTMPADDLTEALTDAGLSESDSKNFLKQLTTTGKVQYDAGEGVYTLSGYGECN